MNIELLRRARLLVFEHDPYELVGLIEEYIDFVLQVVVVYVAILNDSNLGWAILLWEYLDWGHPFELWLDWSLVQRGCLLLVNDWVSLLAREGATELWNHGRACCGGALLVN